MRSCVILSYMFMSETTVSGELAATQPDLID